MQITCALSGISFTCEHFPYTLTSREAFHPVFSIPQKKLLAMTSKWAEGELTATDSYLLFLAVLNSSSLIHWRCAVRQTPFTHSLVAQNMEGLLRAIIKLNTFVNPEQVFPSFSVNPDSATLSNISEWIKAWEGAYLDYKDGYKTSSDARKLQTREEALARMIKSSSANPKKKASQLAEWAALAGNFPTNTIESPLQKNVRVSVADYWKTLIIRCAKNDYVFSLDLNDLRELLDHCHDNIPLGSLYSTTLFQTLKATIEKHQDFLGILPDDYSSREGAAYEVLSASADVESTNLAAVCAAAPEHAPRKGDYPNSFKFLQAKLRWEQACRAGIRGADNG